VTLYFARWTNFDDGHHSWHWGFGDEDWYADLKRCEAAAMVRISAVWRQDNLVRER
jgi:hypothetical protein